MRVILVNPFDETVKEAVYGGDYREIYNLIDCRTFDVVQVYQMQTMICMLDDEGLLVEGNQRYFEYKVSRNICRYGSYHGS